ncbi:hypothetical protein MVLG_04074 [Microbotryum lychnidis-dioicae p1A1 Lamole]|uniref:Pectinesterase n=1 Tax=Microbotryum lychnidis-dioicae (strain p1A1 Lamole / MvSl-1064) TaxID=683840 RepID=U5HA39_USTV1|nr:hypothetical protein MVLG_04074 [Microbotryum lychnidis-dioicae p1A1 Lamole]|eukprot:KDE05579.1 hypothetical protein MVLG_04074 [Microbotryum lychnidis-dioicae p1A1 Lamole]
MKLVSFVVCADLLLFTRAVVAESLSPSELRIRCQACDRPFDAANCPPGTIFVSATDSAASFFSIQAALNSLPDDMSPQTILVGGGEYEEQLIITRQGPLYMFVSLSSSRS